MHLLLHAVLLLVVPPNAKERHQQLSCMVTTHVWYYTCSTALTAQTAVQGVVGQASQACKHTDRQSDHLPATWLAARPTATLQKIGHAWTGDLARTHSGQISCPYMAFLATSLLASLIQA